MCSQKASSLWCGGLVDMPERIKNSSFFLFAAAAAKPISKNTNCVGSVTHAGAADNVFAY